MQTESMNIEGLIKPGVDLVRRVAGANKLSYSSGVSRAWFRSSATSAALDDTGSCIAISGISLLSLLLSALKGSGEHKLDLSIFV